MMRFTFESPKRFTRIAPRLQRTLSNPDIWFPCNSEEKSIKSVSSKEYETMVSSVKSIHVGEKLINPKSGDVFYKIVFFAKNDCYYQDSFLVFELLLAELLEYFDIK